MPTTSTGDAIRIASVNGLRTNVSAVRRVSTFHCVERAGDGTPLDVSSAPVRSRTDRDRTGVVCRRVGIGQAVVEPGDGAYPEVLQRGVDGADERHPSAARHEDDAIAQREVVGRMRREHDGRGTIGQRAQVGDQFGAGRRVQPGRRLVEEQHARLGQQFGGDAGPFALSPAQRADAHVGVLGQADRRNRSADRSVGLGRRGRRWEPEPGGVAQRALEREVGVDRVVLGHVADHAAELAKVGVKVDTVEAHRSR